MLDSRKVVPFSLLTDAVGSCPHRLQQRCRLNLREWPGSHMKPSAFDYIRVETLDEALSVLADSDLEAKILAGGQSLLPILNMRLAQPKALVDINKLAALQTLEQLPANTSTGNVNGRSDGTLLQIGALVRQRQLERYAAEEPRARLIHTA